MTHRTVGALSSAVIRLSVQLNNSVSEGCGYCRTLIGNLDWWLVSVARTATGSGQSGNEAVADSPVPLQRHLLGGCAITSNCHRHGHSVSLWYLLASYYPCWLSRCVGRVIYECHLWLCVCVTVRTLKEKRLELSIPNSVHVYSVSGSRHASTPKSKRQRSRSRGY